MARKAASAVDVVAGRTPRPTFRVLVTRSVSQGKLLVQLLRGLGAAVWHMPAIRLAPAGKGERLTRIFRNLDTYDWLVFTSVNGVDFFVRLLKKYRVPRSRFDGTRIAAIGQVTAEHLRAYRFRVDLIPRQQTSEGLAAAFAKHPLRGKRVLLARADRARGVLAKGLRARGAKVDQVTTYRILKPNMDLHRLRSFFQQPGPTFVTLASSESARNFLQTLPKNLRSMLGHSVAIASLGPITSRTLRKAGLPVAVEAERPSAASLVAAIRKCLRSNHGLSD